MINSNDFDKTLCNIDIQSAIGEDKHQHTREIMLTVYNALCEKGYNPISQIIGYILSEDPTYITTHNQARILIRKVDRDDILKMLLEDFVNKEQNT